MFRPYSAFLSLHILVFLAVTRMSRPSGTYMNLGSSTSPFRKAVFTSICLQYKPSLFTITRNILIRASPVTRAYTSKSSYYSTSWKPLMINLALKVVLPFLSVFFLKTHLESRRLIHCFSCFDQGFLTKSQTWLRSIVNLYFNSCFSALFQNSASGDFIASWYKKGSPFTSHMKANLTSSTSGRVILGSSGSSSKVLRDVSKLRPVKFARLESSTNVTFSPVSASCL